MDPVTLVVLALAAGATAGLKNAASSTVTDAYSSLKALVKKRFAGRPDGELVLAKYEAAPQTWEAPLTAELVAAGAHSDRELIASAQQLMSLIDEAGSQMGKYVVDAKGAQGVQVGDRNIQRNTFGGSVGAEIE
jgi:hypothetical protein